MFPDSGSNLGFPDKRQLLGYFWMLGVLPVLSTYKVFVYSYCIHFL